MSQQLIDHIKKTVDLKPDELEKILNAFRKVRYKKKESLQRPGELCRYNYFVVKGLLRMFFIDRKGVERTVQFALENWWMTDCLAYGSAKGSDFYIQAVETTEVMRLDFHLQEKLLNEVPSLEKYFRVLYQKAYGAAQMRTRLFYEWSREELFHHFNSNYPDFVKRVPQYLLASFLGFTPEYLSEIRKKAVS